MLSKNIRFLTVQEENITPTNGECTEFVKLTDQANLTVVCVAHPVHKSLSFSFRIQVWMHTIVNIKKKKRKKKKRVQIAYKKNSLPFVATQDLASTWYSAHGTLICGIKIRTALLGHVHTPKQELPGPMYTNLWDQNQNCSPRPCPHSKQELPGPMYTNLWDQNQNCSPRPCPHSKQELPGPMYTNLWDQNQNCSPRSCPHSKQELPGPMYTNLWDQDQNCSPWSCPHSKQELPGPMSIIPPLWSLRILCTRQDTAGRWPLKMLFHLKNRFPF